MTPINHSRSVTGAGSLPVAPVARREGNPVDLDSTETLHRLLQETPDVRPEVVARGKALLADPSYPSKETLQRVAELLARHLKPTDE